jgi:ATP-dependent exoDNAse (exonuclease V) alpha subunit
MANFAWKLQLGRKKRLIFIAPRKSASKAVSVSGEQFHRGDRIDFTRNSTFYQVNNGDAGTIQRIGRKRLTWRTFHGKQFSSLLAMVRYAWKIKSDPSLWITVKLDNGKVVDIPLERYQHFRLGYCFNSFQAQGMTVANTFCLLNPLTLSRESIYVSATRARDKTTLYTAGMTTEELVGKAEQSRRKKMAHDFLLENHPQHLRFMGHSRS